MNTLVLTDNFLPHAGGSRVYYYNLYKALAAEWDTEVTIVTKKVPGWREFDRRETTGRFHILRHGRPLPDWKYYQLPRIMPDFARASAVLATKQFEVVHSGDLYPPGVISLLFKSMFRKPYVAFCHGEEITQTDLRRHQPRVRDAIYRSADIVIAANEFALKQLARIGVASDRIRKITPGVDCTRFRPQGPSKRLVERYGLQGKAVLLTVGRLVMRKGHLTVLRALRRIRAKVPSLAYLIVGTGPEERNLRQTAAEWGLADCVHFAGFVAGEDLPEYYSVSDLFVLPNSEDKGDVEGFGMVFLEANACGKAVIAGRSGGALEAVLDGRTGVIVTPEDDTELADAVGSLIQNAEVRGGLGERGLARAQTEFSWGSRVRQLDEINREVIECRKYRVGG